MVEHPVTVRRAGVVLLAALAATIVLGAGIPRISAEVDFVGTVPDHDGLEPYRALLAELDGVRFVAVYMAHDGLPEEHLRTDGGFDALVREQERFTAALTGAFPPATFSHTLSAYEAMRAGNYMLAKMVTAGNPPESAYGLPGDPVTWQAVRQQVIAGGSIDDVVAADGTSALLLAFVATDDDQAARALAGAVDAFVAQWAATPANHPVTGEHQVSGLLWASHYTDERNVEEMVRWGPIAGLAVALALWWATRRATNVVLGLACVGIALVWTYGAMGWSGLRISFLSVFLAPVVIGLGVDHAIHLFHRYEEERTGGRGHRAALAVAVRRTRGPIVAAAASTTAGLAVLLLVPAPLFAEIGGLAAVGVVAGAIAVLTFGVALRAVLPARARRGARPERIGPLVAAIAGHVRKRRLRALAIVGLVTVGAVTMVATQTEVESGSSENEFPQDDPVIRLQHRIEDEYGAFQRAYLVVQGDLTDPVVLRAMHQAVDDAADLPLFRSATAVTDLLLADEATDDGAVDLLSNVLIGATPATPSDEDRLPESQADARARLDALFADPLWRTIAPFVIDRDYRLAVVAIQVDPWEDQVTLRDLRNALVQQAQRLQAAVGPGTDVAAAGGPVNRAAIVDQTPTNIMVVTVGATVAVLATLALAWARRGREGLAAAGVAALVVLVASVWLLATVPLLDGAYAAFDAPYRAPLTDMFLLAFAVTVAVGVDDVVHIANRIWEARRAGAEHPLRTAFGTAGRAITGTTVTTVVGFAVLAGVYFLQSKNLAILTALGVAYAYALTLVLVPSLLGRQALTRAPASQRHGR